MLSRQRGVSLGKAISQLILKSTESSSQGKKRNGALVFPRRAGARIDIDLVNELREYPLTYLLDINVLIALFDASHLNHEAAHRWVCPRYDSK